jgi:hypothetical protein
MSENSKPDTRRGGSLWSALAVGIGVAVALGWSFGAVAIGVAVVAALAANKRHWWRWP